MVSATEATIHGHAIVDATWGENVFAETLCHFRIEDVASLLEGFKTVCIEHLCPDIAVVTCCVAAFHGVGEVGYAVSWLYLTWDATLCQFLCFKLHYVEILWHFCQHMEIHVHV